MGDGESFRNEAGPDKAAAPPRDRGSRGMKARFSGNEQRGCGVVKWIREGGLGRWESMRCVGAMKARGHGEAPIWLRG